MAPGARVVAIHLPITTVPETVDAIVAAERAGVAAVWLTSGGFRSDSLTTLAVAAAQTERIALGSSVAVTYSRHPLTMAQQAMAIDDLAPGRFRLGLGSGHRSTIEGAYGLAFDRPSDLLRTHVDALRQAAIGRVRGVGQAGPYDVTLARPIAVPVYLSALRARGFRLAGEIGDGAISWVTPAAYLRDIAGPAMRQQAAVLGRRPPRLVGHVYGLVTDHPLPVRADVAERLAGNTRMPYYQAMFADSGFPGARDGQVPPTLVDQVTAIGDAGSVARSLERFFDAGCDEVIVSILPGSATDQERTFAAVAQ